MQGNAKAQISLSFFEAGWVTVGFLFIELIFDHNLNFWDEETEKTTSFLKANNSWEGKEEQSGLK